MMDVTRYANTIQYFSNPYISYRGEPIGTLSSNHNSRMLVQSAPIVSAFRLFNPPLSAGINGPHRGNNAGTYTWCAIVSCGGTPPYTYQWEYSLDGFNYSGNLGTGSCVTAPLPQDNDLFLRLTVTDDEGEQDIAFHTVINFDSFDPHDPHGMATSTTKAKSKEQITDNKLTVSPNPVKNFGKLNLTLTELSDVQLKIFDEFGREVLLLHQGELPDGTHRFEFSTEGMQNGVYFCKAVVNQEVITTKLVILN